MSPEDIKDGHRFRFKSGVDLSNDASGKEFTVFRVDPVIEIIYIKFDGSDVIYNLGFDVFSEAVCELDKWRGSKLVFKFV